MFRSGKLLTVVFVLVFGGLAFMPAAAQEKSKKSQPQGKRVMWEQVDISQQDLFLGPGGVEMQPDLTKITFIKEEKGGTSKKFRIKDGAGREWVAKVAAESQAETAAVRLLSGIGYKTEINYLVSSLNIPEKGTFSNVRLEARPETVERLDRWKWDENPFSGTNELQGLKILMALLNNWDLKDGNNILIKKGDELHYVISDLGATFGADGNSRVPIFWRFGRSKNNPTDYVNSDFIKEIEEGRVEFSFKGKGMKLFDDITVAQGRWLADLLTQLNDKQIEDAFRAANYSPEEMKTLIQAVKNRIAALDQITKQKQDGNKS